MQTDAPLQLPTEMIVRLADEGLPVCAIARSLKMPSDDVRETIRAAVAEGVLVEYPKEDWAPSSTRNTRAPRLPSILDDEIRLFVACSRYFGTTRQQAIVLGMLLKRSEVTKEQLHQHIERYRPDAIEQTDIKLVDVLICILRRKLKPFGLKIKTMWGIGYLMDPADRVAAVRMLTEFAEKTNEPLELAA